MPLVKVGDVKEGVVVNTPDYRISEDVNSEYARTQLLGDELLITLVGSPGECVVVKPHMIGWNVARAIAVVRLKDPSLRVYLKSVLESSASKHLIDAALNTTVQKTLNLKDIRQLPIPLPPKSYVDSISSLSEVLSNRISLLKETNATLEAIAQALFKSWFVDFDPVHAKAEGRQPEGMNATTAALFPDSFEESELGLVPKGWEGSTLGKVAEVGIGKTPPRKEAHWFSESEKDIRWVSIKDLGTSGAYISETKEFLKESAVQTFKIRRVPNGSVLLSFKMTIGRVAIADGEMTTNEAIANCKLDDNSALSNEFVYLYLKQFDYSRLSSTSSIAEAVNSKTVRAIPILVPESQILSSFQKLVIPLFERIKSIQHQVKILNKLRDILLPRLISGQLRLPEAEALIKEAV